MASGALHAGLVACALDRAATEPPTAPVVMIEYVNRQASAAASPASSPAAADPARASNLAPGPAPAATPLPPPIAATPGAGHDGLRVTGDDVVSSGPDATFHNMPPHYPRQSALRHEEGSVQVLVHVTADGEASRVDTVQSSGFDALDEAARQAVLTWHFHPALEGGQPVPSVYTLQVNFRTSN